MQSKLTVVFLCTTLALGGLCLVQAKRSSELSVAARAALEESRLAKEEIAARSSTIKSLERKVASLESRSEHLQATLDQTPVAPKPAGDKGVPAPATAAADALEDAADKEKGGLGGMLAKMMSDPEMKKTLREQQKMGLNMIYGDMFKELKATPEEKDKLINLLLDQQMQNMEKGADMMAKLDSTEGRAQMKEEMEKQRIEHEGKMKELLGEERFQQVQDYNANLGNRMVVNQLKNELSSSGTPFSDDQAKQLTLVMREESERAATAEGLAKDGHIKAQQDFETIMSEEKVEELFARQQKINQGVLERAQAFMNAEQLNRLAVQQTNQLNLQKMGLKMAQSMMGKKAPPGAKPTVVPAP